jgi:hypothetical protein
MIFVVVDKPNKQILICNICKMHKLCSNQRVFEESTKHRFLSGIFLPQLQTHSNKRVFEEFNDYNYNLKKSFISLSIFVCRNYFLVQHRFLIFLLPL